MPTLIKNTCQPFRTRFLWVLLAIFSYGLCLSQDPISFKNLSVRDGLSQNSVVDVVQDSLGYLWLATQDGLNRYDGHEFKQYPFQYVDVTRPNFSALGKLYLDRQGHLWTIPQDGSLYKLEKGKEEFKKIDGIKQAYTLFQDAKARLWVGTEKGQVYLKSKSSDSFVPLLPKPLNQGGVRQIHNLADSHVLVLFLHGLHQIDAKGRVYPIPVPSENIAFSSLTQKSENSYWVATHGNGLWELEYAEAEWLWKKMSWDGLPKNLNILDLYQDRRNRLWLGTYGNGLYLYEPKQAAVRHFSPNKSEKGALHYKDILSIYEDYLGVLWFGTDGAGVSFYDQNLGKFNSITNDRSPENIDVDVVRAISTDSLGNIWIGTSGKGLTRYHPETKSFRSFTTSNSALGSDRIMSLFTDPKDQNLWIGTQGAGLFKMDPEGNIKAIELPLKTVWTLYPDHENRLWVGSRNQGLLLLDRNGTLLEHYYKDHKTHKLPDNNIRVITKDAEGSLWLGTDNYGLINLRAKQPEHFTAENSGLETNTIKSLWFDKTYELLWIGTNGFGLQSYNTKTGAFKTYNQEQGLANNVIYAIQPDTQGGLWLSSNKGITKFVPPTHSENAQISNYTNYDGLATEFNTGAYHTDKNGQLFFGALDGCYWFDPLEVNPNSDAPLTNITGFSIWDKEHPLIPDARYPFNENTLSFRFSAMQYSLPARNQFQYRLLPLEESWIDAQNQTQARYPKLPPDDYIFQVRATNYDGIWSPNMAQYPFSIAPPWYWNLYSKSTYALLLLILLWTFYRYLKWRWQMRLNLQLKEQETQRLKDLNTFKSKLYANIAHEFKTPLSLIGDPIRNYLNTNKHGNNQPIELAQRNVKRLDDLVDQLLQLSRLEEGRYQKKPIHGDIHQFTQSLWASYMYQIKERGFTIETQIQAMAWAWFDEDMLQKIWANLIGNALKYSAPNATIQVGAILENDQYRLWVANPVTQTVDLDKLFDRYYQAQPESEGMGIGLALIRELLDLFGGSVVASQQNHHLRFDIQLPVGQEAFTQKELDWKSGNQIATTTSDIEKTNDNAPWLLIVEDDWDTQQYMARFLSEHFRILTAKHGQEGFEKTVAKLPDIIISDVMMPIMDGIQFCNLVKNDPRTSHIPVLLLTASQSVQNELKALQYGVDAYVAKPFNSALLLQRIQNLVNQRKELAKSYASNWDLDPKIDLTPIESQFLEKVQRLLQEALTQPDFNATAMAEKLGVSRMQLHRKLQAYTGQSTSAFIRSQRLKLAKDLLTKGELTVSEVAYASGFNTPSYFMKSFKAQYGMTPSEFVTQQDFR